MSLEEFKQAYDTSNITVLKKYIKNPKILSVKQIVKYASSSFLVQPKVFDIIIQILFTHYEINKVIPIITGLGNNALLEYLLNYDDSLKLNENLIDDAVSEGQIYMAKIIYEYIYEEDEDDLHIISKLFQTYYWPYNPEENSIDSFILAMCYQNYQHAIEIVDHVVPNFWNDFPIRYCVTYFTRYTSLLFEKLLAHDAVDPGANNNYALKTAIKRNNRYVALELLKHPLVQIENINSELVCGIIEKYQVCVAERLLRSEDNNIISLFKQPHIIDMMIMTHNIVTYLAIKLDIFPVELLLETYPDEKSQIKKNLRKIIIEEPYTLKPYKLNLDPMDLLYIAYETEDLDTAKQIKDYSLTVEPMLFLSLLNHYSDTKIGNYMWKNIIKEYDPNCLLFCQIILQHEHPEETEVIKLFDIIKDDPKLDCENIYAKSRMLHDETLWAICTVTMQELIKKKNSTKDYEKFCLKYEID
jgi:hypothetical protein